MGFPASEWDCAGCGGALHLRERATVVVALTSWSLAWLEALDLPLLGLQARLVELGLDAIVGLEGAPVELSKKKGQL